MTYEELIDRLEDCIEKWVKENPKASPHTIMAALHTLHENAVTMNAYHQKIAIKAAFKGTK